MPLRDPAYLRSLRDARCVISGQLALPGDSVVPAHLRFSRSGGTGMKPADNHVLPILQSLHVKQHGMGELQFWRENMTPELLREALIALAEKMHERYRKERKAA